MPSKYNNASLTPLPHHYHHYHGPITHAGMTHGAGIFCRIGQFARSPRFGGRAFRTTFQGL